MSNDATSGKGMTSSDKARVRSTQAGPVAHDPWEAVEWERMRLSDLRITMIPSIPPAMMERLDSIITGLSRAVSQMRASAMPETTLDASPPMVAAGSGDEPVVMGGERHVLEKDYFDEAVANGADGVVDFPHGSTIKVAVNGMLQNRTVGSPKFAPLGSVIEDGFGMLRRHGLIVAHEPARCGDLWLIGFKVTNLTLEPVREAAVVSPVASSTAAITSNIKLTGRDAIVISPGNEYHRAVGEIVGITSSGHVGVTFPGIANVLVADAKAIKVYVDGGDPVAIESTGHPDEHRLPSYAVDIPAPGAATTKKYLVEVQDGGVMELWLNLDREPAPGSDTATIPVDKWSDVRAICEIVESTMRDNGEKAPPDIKVYRGDSPDQLLWTGDPADVPEDDPSA